MKAIASNKEKARQTASFNLTLAEEQPNILVDSPAKVVDFRPYIIAIAEQ